MDLIILLLTLVASVIAADNCSIAPIFVDFHDRCVDDCFTIQYGLFIGVGNPFQNESLWPSLSHNETTIAGVEYCDDDSSSTCVNQTHGVFSPELSTTFVNHQDYTPLDAEESTLENIASPPVFGRDTLNIYTHYFDPSPPNLTQVPNYPVSVLSNYTGKTSPWFGPAGLLGLGSASTLLTALQDMNLISSRSFGLYMGTAYPRAGGAINGSLTLGGYDSGRLAGDAVRYDLSTPAVGADRSPYKVQVASISLTDFGNDNATTIISSGAFDAILTTSQYEMTLPNDITQQFIDSTSALFATPEVASISGANRTPLTIPSSFSGALTISLSSGLNITLDTATGTLRNMSNLTPLIAPPFDTTIPSTPLLGTSLLSHLYLTTNYDSTPPSFYLSPASIHGPYVMTQPLCANTVPIAYQSLRISSFARNGIIGAILGGVIGGIGLTFALFYGWRKYAQKKASQAWEEKYGDDERGGGWEIDAYGNKIPMTTRGGLGASDSENLYGGAAVSKRAKLKGILKPSSQRHSNKRRKIDKGTNPISAYYAERNMVTTPYPKKSWSSSDSDLGEEGYDMSQLQGSLPPHIYSREYANSNTQVNPAESVRAATLVQPHPSRSPPRKQQQEHPRLARSESHSRSRSPSPVFSPDERIPSSYTHFSSPRPVPRAHEPPSVSFPRRDADGQSFATVALTPNTPVPLLSHPASTNNHLRPLVTSHMRTSSEERRKAMNLTVKTEFDGPPGREEGERVGKKFKPGKEKANVQRKPVSEEFGMLRRMFPAGS